jgi:hypothetical protein
LRISALFVEKSARSACESLPRIESAMSVHDKEEAS